MGPIFIILLALVAAAIMGRILGEAGPRDRWFRLGGAAIAAFIGAWLAGSATQAASFVMGAPGWQTLLGGFVGGLIGSLIGSIVARRRVS